MLNPDGTENTSSTFIGNVNPIRYRGYYYDAEFGLYYLQTRYYDPETGRFISQDESSYLAPETINGLNLFAYCNNNPVMNVDPEGTAWWHWVVGALVVVAATALTVVTCGAAAVALGASAAVVAGVMAGAAVGGLVVGGANLISQGLTGDGSVDFGSLLSSTLLGGVVGGVIGGFAGYYAPMISTFMNSSFTASIPWVTMSGGSLAFSSVGVTVTGAQLVAGTALGLTIFFSQNAERFLLKDKRRNTVQNDEFKRICDEYHLNKKQRARLHHKITKKGYSADIIIDIIKELFPQLFI